MDMTQPDREREARAVVRQAFCESKHLDIYEKRPYRLIEELEERIAAALLQDHRAAFEEAAKVAEDFDLLKWLEIERKYKMKLDSLHPNLGGNIAAAIRQRGKAL